MTRFLPLLVVLTLVTVGCDNKGQRAGTAPEPTQLAAYAATTHYPDPARDEDLRFGALIEPDGDLRLINYSGQAISNFNVWVNKEYVYRVPSLAPKGMITLGQNLFFNDKGRDLKTAKVTPNLVQVQVENKLFDALGPVRVPK